jgi:hypothetical protein
MKVSLLNESANNVDIVIGTFFDSIKNLSIFEHYFNTEFTPIDLTKYLEYIDGTDSGISIALKRNKIAITCAENVMVYVDSIDFSTYYDFHVKASEKLNHAKELCRKASINHNAIDARDSVECACEVFKYAIATIQKNQSLSVMERVGAYDAMRRIITRYLQEMIEG